MKSIIVSEKAEAQSKPFPKLMEAVNAEDLIVLFWNEDDGTIIHTPDVTIWPMFERIKQSIHFRDTDKKILLSND